MTNHRCYGVLDMVPITHGVQHDIVSSGASLNVADGISVELNRSCLNVTCDATVCNDQILQLLKGCCAAP